MSPLPASVTALLFLFGCAALSGCAAAGRAGDGSSGMGGDAEPTPYVSDAETWITIRDFRQVGAVAASDRVVYLGSTAGLERWETLRDAWLSPLTSWDGLPDGHVTALAVDRLGTDVWIGTRRGLARLSFDDVVEPVWGPPPASVTALLLDPADGTLYALVGGAWWSGRGGTLERSGPPAGAVEGSVRVEDIDPARVPWIDPLYARSRVFSRIFRLTEVDRDVTGDWYAGTWGDNGRRWRAVGAEWEPLYYGLAGEGGGPVVRSEDGMWFVPGEAGTAPAALAHASESLERWSYVVPQQTPELPVAVWRDAVALGDTLLLAGDYGLAWGAGPAWRDAGREDVGLATYLALDGGVVWVGTERGLLAWDPAAGAVAATALDGRFVTAVAATRGALVVGTDAGVWIARRAPEPAPPHAAQAVADSLVRLETGGRSVRAMAVHGELVVVAGERGLETLDPETGARIPASVPEVRALALASDGESVWVGTEDGLARWRPETGEWRAYGQGDGLPPGPVTHVLALDGEVWASTPAGVTRYAWRGDEP